VLRCLALCYSLSSLCICSLCHASRDNELLVQACLGRGQFSGAREVVLLQASNSFFAYEPILKALQQMTVLPMAQYLVPGLAGPGAACHRSFILVFLCCDGHSVVVA
jgi:hypothetical protein